MWFFLLSLLSNGWERHYMIVYGKFLDSRTPSCTQFFPLQKRKKWNCFSSFHPLVWIERRKVFARNTKIRPFAKLHRLDPFQSSRRAVPLRHWEESKWQRKRDDGARSKSSGSKSSGGVIQMFGRRWQQNPVQNAIKPIQHMSTQWIFSVSFYALDFYQWHYQERCRHQSPAATMIEV